MITLAELFESNLRRDELNRSLGGGLPKKSMVLVEGKDGAGKSILGQRLSYGLLLNKTSVTYISSELNTDEFLEQMRSLDYDVTFQMLDGTLLFIPMFPTLGQTKEKEQFFEKLLATPEIFENDVIIFDTLSFLLIPDDLSHESMIKIINKIKKIVSLGKTIMFCVDPDHINQSFLTLLRSISDVYIKVEVRTFAGAPLRVIVILRFKRPGENIVSTIPFKVETGKGLALEIASLS